MKVIVADNYEQQSALAADIIEKIVRENPECCLGLATGSSPVGMYKELARRCKEEGLECTRNLPLNLGDIISLSVGNRPKPRRYRLIHTAV